MFFFFWGEVFWGNAARAVRVCVPQDAERTFWIIRSLYQYCVVLHFVQ